MNNTAEKIAATSKATLEAAQALATKGQAHLEKLVDLNMTTSKTVLGESFAHAKAVLVAFLTASAACAVAAVKFAWAASTACLAELCAETKAFWLALMALLKKAMADSVPVGAFFVAFSINVAKPFCTSAMLACAALVNSALAPAMIFWKS